MTKRSKIYETIPVIVTTLLLSVLILSAGAGEESNATNGPITVANTSPGGLSAAVAAELLLGTGPTIEAEVVSLTVTGALDTVDIDYIGNNFANMVALDLSDASFSGNIPDGWMLGRTSLASVSLPYGSYSIGDYAFESTGLTGTITIPSGVTSVGHNAFYSTPGISELILPATGSLTIGDHAFQNTGITGTLTIPSSVTSIGDHAFRGTGITGTLTIPSSVTSIGDYAFYGLGITELILPAVGSLTIGELAFNNTNLTGTLTIPSSVTSIGDYAFYGLGITELILPATGSLTIGESVFQGTGITGTLTIPSGVMSIGYAAFYGLDITELILPTTGSLTIGDRAFQNTDITGTLTIPSSVTSIGDYAFQGTAITDTLTIPSSVTSIGDYAFYGLDLTKLVLPATGLATIGTYAFNNTNLSGTLTIPSSVTSIGFAAFYGLSNITTLEFTATTAPTVDVAAFDLLSTTGIIYYPVGGTGYAPLTNGPSGWLYANPVTISGKITGSDAPGGIPAVLQLIYSGTEVGSSVTAGSDGTYATTAPAGTICSLEVDLPSYIAGSIAVNTIVNMTGEDLTLQKKTYSISVSETGTHNFGHRSLGYSPITAWTITVTNTGNQATGGLTVALSGVDLGSFTLSTTSIGSISAGNTDTFTIRPNDGLAVKNFYTATVTVTGNSSIVAQSFAVSFTVDLIPTIISAHDLSVRRGTTGTLQVTTTGTAPITYLLTGAPLGVTIDATGLMRIDPNTASGTHNYTITASNTTGVDYVQAFTLTVIDTDVTISVFADSNSTITPSGSQIVKERGSLVVSFSAKPGNIVTDVIIDGVSHNELISGGSYIFSNVTDNHVISVYSSSIPQFILTVDIVGGEGYAEYHTGHSGYTKFTRTVNISAGSDVHLRVVSADGYEFVNWTGDIDASDPELHIGDFGNNMNLTAHLKATDSDGDDNNNASIVIIAAIVILIIIIAAALLLRRSRA